MTTDTTSQGFDLDALAASSAGDEDEVVYELGGGVTVIPAVKEEKEEEATKTNNNNNTPTAEENEKDEAQHQHEIAENYKQRGNEEFKLGHYLEACDLYTNAIDSCPCPYKGSVILKLQEQHDKAQHEKKYRSFQQQEKERKEEKLNETTTNDKSKTTTTTTTPTTSSSSSSSAINPNNNNNNKDDDTKEEDSSIIIPFSLPKQPYSESLAIYYCNRAASQYSLAHYDAVIQDTTISSILNPSYTKSFVRRSMAHEQLDHLDLALLDMKQAQTLEPKNPQIMKHMKRLQVLEDKRMEVLKEETIGKLKDLGNSLLGNFGLSLDNFKTVQDPQTGSYNIQFEQGGGSKK